MGEKKWTGWKPKSDEQTVEFKKIVTERTKVMKTILLPFRGTSRLLPGRWLITRKQRKIKMSTPENVRLREEAAARSTAKIERKVLKKQARKARADHQVKCCLEPGKKKTKRQPLTELYVKGHSTEDTEEWQKELQRHCEEVYTDQEETKEAQESRIENFKKKGNQHFTEEGRNAEITVDLVLQARAKLSDDKVNGPEDAIVSEMIKRLPMEKMFTIVRCCQERFSGLMESPSSWKKVKLVFLRYSDVVPQPGIRS